uniref:Putative secreted peptide n=1 Tax=Anopheles braziliensis TaxID=58242 RepID=A0A2M3ZXD3_9DIPT
MRFRMSCTTNFIVLLRWSHYGVVCLCLWSVTSSSSTRICATASRGREVRGSLAARIRDFGMKRGHPDWLSGTWSRKQTEVIKLGF